MLSNEEMLVRLKALLDEKGELTASIIDAADALPCHNVYMRRFGSLRKAYAAIGYVSEHLRYSDGRRATIATLVEFREALVDELTDVGHTVGFNQMTGHLTIDRAVTVSVVVARCLMQRGGFPRWNIGRKLDRDRDLVAVARMDEANQSILDYLVVPPARLPGISIPIGMQNPANINASLIGRLEEVVGAIEKHRRFKDLRGRGARQRKIRSLPARRPS